MMRIVENKKGYYGNIKRSADSKLFRYKSNRFVDRKHLSLDETHWESFKNLKIGERALISLIPEIKGTKTLPEEVICYIFKTNRYFFMYSLWDPWASIREVLIPNHRHSKTKIFLYVIAMIQLLNRTKFII